MHLVPNFPFQIKSKRLVYPCLVYLPSSFVVFDRFMEKQKEH